MDTQQLVLLVGLIFCVLFWVEYRVQGLRRENEDLKARVTELERRMGGRR
jgi:hypothetical protein